MRHRLTAPHRLRGAGLAALLWAACLLVASLFRSGSAQQPLPPGAVADAPPSERWYWPLVAAYRSCEPIPGELYQAIWVLPPPTDPPAAEHPDLNLALRGQEPTEAYLGLVDYGGYTDPTQPPQLPGLFADNRTAAFASVQQVYDWDWENDQRGPLLTSWEVTLGGLATAPGETVHVPPSGYEIGSGYEVLVLYADPQRVTLKYTREDGVAQGYTLHLEGICVEPRLLALYEVWNAAGRAHLPALRAGQGVGRAVGTEVRVAIRDSGAFLDPRSRKDWWRGR